MTLDFAQVVARLSAAAGAGLLAVAVATTAFGQASGGISSGASGGVSGGSGGISAGAGASGSAGASAPGGSIDASGSANAGGTVSPSGTPGVSASGKATSVSPTPGTRPGSSAAGTRPGSSSAGTRPGASSAGTRPGRTGSATRVGGTNSLTRPSGASATSGADATADSDTTTSGSAPRTGASGSTGGSSGRLDPNRDIREVLRDNEFYREHGRFPRPGELPPLSDTDTDTDPSPTSPRGIVRPGDPTANARRTARFNQNQADTTDADTAPEAEDLRSDFGDLEDRFDTRSRTTTDADVTTDPADASATTTTDTTTDTNSDVDSVRDAANQFQDRFRDARETFQDTRDDARDTFSDARDDIRSGTSDDTVRDAARDFQDTTRDARDTLRDVRDTARDTFRDTRDDLRDTRVSADFRVDTLRSADIGLWFDRSAEGLVISDLATTGLITSLGFREGDQIISVNGQRVARERDFLELVFADPSLNRVDVVVERFGRQIVIPVNPSALVREFTTASVQVDPVENFGVVLDDRYPGYVVVWRVTPRSPAFYAGLRPGDVIVNWQGQRITSPTEFTRFLQSAEPGSVNIEVSRNRQVRRFDVDLPSLDAGARASSRTMLRPDFDATIRGDADVRARGADVRVRGDADADAEFARPRIDNRVEGRVDANVRGTVPGTRVEGNVEVDGGARGGILPRLRRN